MRVATANLELRLPYNSFRARLFWIVSRTAHAVYTLFPVFGTLRGAVVLLRRNDTFLVIERNDGYGLSFPGGISRSGERPESTIEREVLEETGLTVTSLQFRFDFHHSHPFRTHTYVFEAAFQGELRSSWEGNARFATLPELQSRVVPQQQHVVAYLVAQSIRAR